jgi:hypothetical protein
MKFIFILAILFMVSAPSIGQKYALLDKDMIRPVRFTNQFTPTDQKQDLFPVEKKRLKEFVKVLQQIVGQLSSQARLKEAKQYKVGCIFFEGKLLSLARGDRLDYVINSTCTGYNMSVHLSDFKLPPENNIYFINTWIKYIRASQYK